MRRLFVLLLVLSLSIAPCIGCGESKPDPRDHPDFVDDTDPSMTTGLDGDTGPGAAGAEAPGAEAPAETPAGTE